ncbi:MAG: putative ABC transporter permease [Firmicutes bacterium]|nr:putative ABC transporter permease [Candidatus Caballimonas caccae]
MRVNIIGSISFYDMLLYYIIYSFLGWCLEAVYATLKTGKFVNRGFLNGPVCPIYGFGMAICVLLLNTLVEKWYLLFIVGMLFASMIEFLTGFILEKIFKLKWWDYSKEPFNIKGYICLKFSLLWGLAILLMFKTLVPLTDTIIDALPYNLGLVIIISCFITLIVDFSCTIIQLNRIKRNIKELSLVGSKLKDGSNKIGEKISDVTVSVSEKIEEINERIKKTRLGKAFPIILKKGENLIDDIKDKVSEKLNKKDK